jgi:hypothetical protein
MALSAKEVHFYNNLSDQGLVKKITCPFGEDDIIVTKEKDSGEVYFECITCNSSFDPGINIIQNIKTTIDKFKSKV